MPDEENQYYFESFVPFNEERIQAAAVYCSDGRFGEQFDDLLQNALALPRYVRLAVPGGAACLASHFNTYREEQGVLEQLRFLVQTHDLEEVVLIAHQNCGFYTHRLRVSPLQLESKQRDDMRKAIHRVHTISKYISVRAFFTRITWDGKIRFEVVEV